ncbi:unnamed protein product [Bursaphelenchus okinawaensis]|uniref:Uncharacterized protein n=1 Tax=Bursaphelenchus okinawaensis TaxID=465554 RepID=A0A811JPQ2_9BILA|nr:unnamed protein product [Bursaphelenchus okinawaensis]CAG9076884.1 unnamed protein product [Bursaphelenchus okinawaensis]
MGTIISRSGPVVVDIVKDALSKLNAGLDSLVKSEVLRNGTLVKLNPTDKIAPNVVRLRKLRQLQKSVNEVGEGNIDVGGSHFDENRAVENRTSGRESRKRLATEQRNLKKDNIVFYKPNVQPKADFVWSKKTEKFNYFLMTTNSNFLPVLDGVYTFVFQSGIPNFIDYAKAMVAHRVKDTYGQFNGRLGKFNRICERKAHYYGFVDTSLFLPKELKSSASDRPELGNPMLLPDELEAEVLCKAVDNIKDLVEGS